MAIVSTWEIIETYLGGLWGHLPFYSAFEVPMGLSFLDDLRKPWVEKVREWLRRMGDKWWPFGLSLWRRFRAHRWASIVAVAVASFTWANFETYSEIYTSKKMTESKLVEANDKAGIYTRRFLPDDAVEKAKSSLKNKPLLKAAIIPIGSSRDNDSMDYTETIQRLFLHAKLHVFYGGTATQKPGQTGVILFEFDPDHPSGQASELAQLLADSGIDFHVMKWLDHEGWDMPTDFCIYVTRNEPVVQ